MKEKLLVVDDNTVVCNTFVESLEFSGFTAKGVLSARDALEEISRTEWDLVLADVMMADMDGLELLKQIKEKNRYLPVIMITGQRSVQTAIDAVKLGAEDYLFKPFKIEELIHRIQTVIDINNLRLMQIHERKENEEKIRVAYEELEKRVQERTAELAQKNRELKQEIIEKQKVQEALYQESNKLVLKLKHEKLIADIALLLNSSNTFTDYLDELLCKIANSLKIESVCIYEIDEKYKNARRIGNGYSSNGSSKLKNQDIIPFEKMPQNLLRKITCLKRYSYNDGEGSDFNRNGFLEEIGVKTLVMLPIAIDQKLMGVISFANSAPTEWSQGTIELFKTISNIIGNAWERQIQVTARVIAEKKQAEAMQMAERASRFFSLGTMAAGISHEINQPLTALKTKVDGMLYWKRRNKRFSNENIEKNLEFMSDQTERIDDIIRHMRALAHQNSTVDKIPVPVNSTIQKALSLIERQIASHDINVTLDLCDEEIEITGSPTQLEQIVINLTINAMQALDTIPGPDKIIAITTFRNDDMCVLEISDNGPGISEKNINRVFDPFYTNKVDGKGMGLGLSITQNIVMGMEGNINVRNGSEGGASFSISFPVLEKVKMESQ